jgi:hypothetical protein
VRPAGRRARLGLDGERWGRLANLGLVSLWVLSVCVSLLLREVEFGHDDAFITNVYADNLARGSGLVFNPTGERVWGYTSPAHTLLLGLPGLLGIPVHRAGIFLSLFLVIPICDLIYRIGHAVSGRPACAMAISVLFATSGLFYSFLGLECNLLILLQLLFLWLVMRRAYDGAALAGGLSCLARPDSVLLVVAMALGCRGLRTRRSVAIFSAVGFSWLGFTLAYYGDVLPQSFHAKTQSASFLMHLQYNVHRLLATGIPVIAPFHPGFRDAFAVIPGWLVAIVKLGLGLCVLKGPAAYRASLMTAFLAYPVLAGLGYAGIGAPHDHFWELQSPYFFLSLAPFFGGLALMAAFERRSRRQRPSPPARRRQLVVRWAGAGLLVVALAANASSTLGLLREQETAYWRGARLRTYVRIAEWIVEHAPPSSTLLAVEPGTIRYFIEREDVRIVDLMGVTWRGKPLRACRRPCYYLAYGRRDEAITLGHLSFVPRHYFPEIGFADFTLMERRRRSTEPAIRRQPR